MKSHNDAVPAIREHHTECDCMELAEVPDELLAAFLFDSPYAGIRADERYRVADDYEALELEQLRRS